MTEQNKVISKAIEEAVKERYLSLNHSRVNDILCRLKTSFTDPIKVSDKRLSPYQKRKQREVQAEGKGFTNNEFRYLCASFNNKCLRCGSTENLVPDHVTPLKRGGRHDLDNIQPLCLDCNFWKGLQIIDFR